jgi:hypothetical protein
MSGTAIGFVIIKKFFIYGLGALVALLIMWVVAVMIAWPTRNAPIPLWWTTLSRDVSPDLVLKVMATYTAEYNSPLFLFMFYPTITQKLVLERSGREVWSYSMAKDTPTLYDMETLSRIVFYNHGNDELTGLNLFIPKSAAVTEAEFTKLVTILLEEKMVDLYTNDPSNPYIPYMESVQQGEYEDENGTIISYITSDHNTNKFIAGVHSIAIVENFDVVAQALEAHRKAQNQ